MTEQKQGKGLEVYAWSKEFDLTEECATILGRKKSCSFNYVVTYNSNFVQSGNTPTPYMDFWDRTREKIRNILIEKGLREFNFYDGIVPPLEDWKNEINIQPIPILAYNYFIIELPVSNFP